MLDVIDRTPIASNGTYDASGARVSTYRLVGAQFFLFFAALMAGAGILWIGVAMLYREHTYVREDVARKEAAATV